MAQRKALDWKLRTYIFTIPPNDKATVITIDVHPKRGRAEAEVPEGTGLKVVKPLTIREPSV